MNPFSYARAADAADAVRLRRASRRADISAAAPISST